MRKFALVWAYQASVYLCQLQFMKQADKKLHLYRPHSEGMGKVLFSQVSVCPHPSSPTGRGTHISGWRGVTPSSLTRGGTPCSLMGGYLPFQAGWGYPHPQETASQRILAMLRAVCLLRSRRRTFLLILYFYLVNELMFSCLRYVDK